MNVCLRCEGTGVVVLPVLCVDHEPRTGLCPRCGGTGDSVLTAAATAAMNEREHS